MNHYFISNDVIFLYGIEAVLNERNIKKNFINTSHKYTDFHPQAGDLVILAESNALQRNAILRTPGIRECRLVIMPDIPAIKPCPLAFPCILPKGISASYLLWLIDRAVGIPVKHDRVPHQMVTIFSQLGLGNTIRDLSDRSLLSIKYISRIKRMAFREYGLTNCNAVGILLCQDMLRMKIPV